MLSKDYKENGKMQTQCQVKLNSSEMRDMKKVEESKQVKTTNKQNKENKRRKMTFA